MHQFHVKKDILAKNVLLLIRKLNENTSQSVVRTTNNKISFLV